MADHRLIVALDVPSFSEMKSLVETLGESVSFYKVGMELFYAAGEEAVMYLRGLGKEVFLDLKLHDIPNTVAHGIASLTRLGASMLTIHGQGGKPMMEAAVQKAEEVSITLGVPRPKLLAITVLTSFDEESWSAIGGSLPMADRVVALAKLAQEAGVDGVVASPLEAARIRKACGDDFLIVTPGIRPSFATSNDQKRIATPALAIQSGATHLVVGRPITKSYAPVITVDHIIKEMGQKI